MKEIFKMPDTARVWIYVADRLLNEGEEAAIRREAQQFIDQWSSHGTQMDASAELLHHRILVIAADEEKALASGCGIDKSVKFVQQLGASFGIDFFKRTIVLYRKEGEIEESALNVFWAMRKAGLVSDETIIFDNTVKNIGELRSAWEVPFSKSWHNEMWLR